jgi:predicted nicotinamide N-methyase
VSSSIEAASLRDGLTRRFRTTTRALELAGRTIDLLMPANADELISEADFDRDERLPYWADLWPSARVLAEELAVLRLSGQRVLELGCGLGVVAIGAVLGGAAVTATDYYEDATLFARLNVHAATGATIEARMVNWVALPPDLGKFDVVVASDVLYEHRYASLVANAIAATLVRGGEAIVADPGRIALREFLDECDALGLEHSSDARPFVDGEIKQTVTLWTLRWRT